MKKVIVTQKEDAIVSTEVLAENILAISEGVKQLRKGRLNEKALILLIQHSAPKQKNRKNFGSYVAISARDVKAVLEGIENLAETYLKPLKK